MVEVGGHTIGSLGWPADNVVGPMAAYEIF